MRNWMLTLAPLLALQTSAALALEVGFEGAVSYVSSDNVNEDNRGEELDGSLAFSSFKVFGEHRSARLKVGFLGELESRRQFDDLDTDVGIDTVPRFAGAAEFRLTPRVLSWYVGDVMGGTRTDNAFNTESEQLDITTNAFITGPLISLELGPTATLNTSLYFVHLSDDTDVDREQLLRFRSDYRSDLSAGLVWGLNLTDVYTDNPDSSAQADFNRASGNVFLERERGNTLLVAGIGVTNYRADDEQVTGGSASLRYERTISDQSTFFARLGRDLVDQTLIGSESLISQGNFRQAESGGVYNDTNLTLGYSYGVGRNEIAFSAGAAESDFEVILDDNGFSTIGADNEDQYRYFGRVTGRYGLTPRLDTDFSLGYQQEEFRETTEFSNSLLARVSLGYRLSRSFIATLGYEHEQNEGEVIEPAGTRLIDTVENRVQVGLLFKPPTRTSSALTNRLSSLVY